HLSGDDAALRAHRWAASADSVPVALLTPWLSSWWVALITPVSQALAEPLIESLAHDLTCREHDIADHVPDPPEGLLDYEQSVRRALNEGPLADGGTDSAMAQPMDQPGAGGPVFTERRTVRTAASAAQL
ncbi:MAG: DUF2867 domain-containing protein, partial [Pseudonocardiaceae bacterium]